MPQTVTASTSPCCLTIAPVRRLNTRAILTPLLWPTRPSTIREPRSPRRRRLDDAARTGELIPDYESTFPTINEGEVVHGTVVRVDKDEVLVDIGYKSEGVIPVSELSIRRSVNPADEVSLGDEIAALVMTKEDAEGRLILSKKRARFEIAWKAIEQAHEQGEPVTGRVIEVVKGGLILDLGVRGFLPASLVDIRRVQDLDEFLGQELRCKVIELNRSRNNVVLSRRAVLEDERKEMRQAILDRLNPGDVVEGTISNIVDFGAFVDLDGMDGLIHISELSWSHVNHPSEVLEIGQKVNVKVLDIDRDRQRISLGLKQTQTDPWQQVLESYQEGDVVPGKVTKVVTFGAFVEILPGVEGLVHISELAQHHVENPREVVSQGDTVNVRILEVDAERRRLSLSLKRVEDGMPRAAGPGEEAPPPALDLSENVFADDRRAARASRSRSRRVDAEPERREPEPRSRAAAPRAAAEVATPKLPPTSPPRARDEAAPPPPKSRAVPAAARGRDHRGHRGREERGARRVRAARRRDRRRATRSCTDLPRRRRGASAIRERWGDDAGRRPGRIGEIVFGDRAELDWLEQLLHPKRREAMRATGSTSRVRRAACARRRRDPAPLRDGRRDALRRGRRRHRAARRCARRGAARSPTARRGSSPTRRSCGVPTSPS